VLGTAGKVDTEMDGNRAALRVSSQRFGIQGYALAKHPGTSGRILAPQVLVDRGNVERPTSSGYSESRVPQMASVAVLDEDAGSILPSSLDDSLDSAVNLGWGEPQVKECLLPRVALLDPKAESLFVGCLGVDQVVEYDAMSADPRRAEVKRWGVPAGPTGLALDPTTRRLFVWSQFDRMLSAIDVTRSPSDADELDAGLLQLALSRPAGRAMQGDVALGRKLFYDVGNLEISADGRACASCHIEGRDDGLTWATPDGPRQTPVLMGRLTGTAPFGWTGSGEKLSEHMQKTFSRLGGKGLEGDELAAMLAYVASLEPPDRAALEASSEIERGRQVFHAADTGCATCHSGDTLTDGERHNVKSSALGDAAKAFDTPSLLHIKASAPYFHDGRFANLREMLDATSGTMGKTSHLSAADKNALVAYLETL
jgi:mono/diheme cytochrome c family protein